MDAARTLGRARTSSCTGARWPSAATSAATARCCSSTKNPEATSISAFFVFQLGAKKNQSMDHAPFLLRCKNFISIQ